MAVMIPVTMTTMPSTQKSPVHDVKSTCSGGDTHMYHVKAWGLPTTQLPSLTPGQDRARPLLTLVWKQKTVTMMATMAVMSMAIRTALVWYMLWMEGTPESPHGLGAPCHGRCW